VMVTEMMMGPKEHACSLKLGYGDNDGDDVL
jgi:hypothetical protein